MGIFEDFDNDKDRWEVSIYYSKVSPSYYVFRTEEAARGFAGDVIKNGACSIVIIKDRKEVNYANTY